MSMVVNTANFVIQSAARLGDAVNPLRRSVTTKEQPELVGVVEVEILPCLNPYVKWYRHPIWWWKWRHFRHDVKVMEEAVDPEFRDKFNEELERKILEGDDR